ncbi:MAG: S8 family serine peptidase [Saprospiraceae bacterium]|nr:S8 family serine peptidase [Saprospiraceae bacterium]
MKNLRRLVVITATHLTILSSLFSQPAMELTCTPGNGSITIEMEAIACLLVAPINISWSGPVSGEMTIDNIPDSIMHTEVIAGLEVGSYAITVTTGNQCSSSCGTTVIQGAGCQLGIKDADLSLPTCYGANNGRITLEVVNAEGSVTFLWNDGNTEGPQRTGLAAGAYSVTVTDQDSCQAVGSYTLYPDDGGVFPFVIAQYPDSSFALPRTGGFEMGTDGGELPLSAHITSAALGYDKTINNISNIEFSVGELAAGDYTVVIKDAAGCDGATTVNIGYKREIPPGLFIVEFSEDITPAEYFEEISKLETQNARLLKKCRCGKDGINYVQLWETLDLLTSGESSTTKTRPDTSGLSQSLLIKDKESTTGRTPCEGQATSTVAQSVNVAIIDSGLDLRSPQRPNGHSQLTDMYWTNNRTSNGGSEKGCPNNDYEGYDFVVQDGEVIDSIGHGTHLAGIFKNNMPENVNYKLMNLKVCSHDTLYSNSIFDLVCAIHYAVDSGAQVINLSLGYTSSIPSVPLYNALKRAEKADIPVVVSAGNDSLDLDTLTKNLRWPIYFKNNHGNGEFKKLCNMLVITSIDDAGLRRDSYANYGDTLVDIATTGNFRSTFSYFNASGTYIRDTTMSFKGTSQAAAYASSVIGAIKAHLPSISVSRLFNEIRLTAKPVAGLKNTVAMGGVLNPAGLFTQFNTPININAGIANTNTMKLQPKWPAEQRPVPGATVNGLLFNSGKQTTFKNVLLVVTADFTDSGGVKEVYRKYYCATDMIDWTLPNPIPSNVRQYFVNVYVNNAFMSPAMPLTPE